MKSTLVVLPDSSTVKTMSSPEVGPLSALNLRSPLRIKLTIKSGASGEVRMSLSSKILISIFHPISLST